jgi:hypothetical protein
MIKSQLYSKSTLDDFFYTNQESRYLTTPPNISVDVEEENLTAISRQSKCRISKRIVAMLATVTAGAVVTFGCAVGYSRSDFFDDRVNNETMHVPAPGTFIAYLPSQYSDGWLSSGNMVIAHPVNIVTQLGEILSLSLVLVQRISSHLIPFIRGSGCNFVTNLTRNQDEDYLREENEVYFTFDGPILENLLRYCPWINIVLKPRLPPNVSFESPLPVTDTTYASVPRLTEAIVEAGSFFSNTTAYWRVPLNGLVAVKDGVVIFLLQALSDRPIEVGLLGCSPEMTSFLSLSFKCIPNSSFNMTACPIQFGVPADALSSCLGGLVLGNLTTAGAWWENEVS